MRWSCLTLLIGLALLMANVWASSRPSGPEHGGRALSQWLEIYTDYSSTSSGSPSTEEAAKAVRNIGTNAIPYLLGWIRYEQPAWRRWVGDIIPKLPMSLSHWLSDRSLFKAWGAVAGFEILGVESKSAIPGLTLLINDPEAGDSSRRAMRALAHMGDEGIQALLESVKNPAAPYRDKALSEIGQAHTLGANINPAMPAILRCLNDKDNLVNDGAWHIVIGRFALLEPQMLLNNITNNLPNFDQAGQVTLLEVLSKLGEAARPAMPTVVGLLNCTNVETRNAATNALRKIAPERLKAYD